jgi:hypothetical protein
MDIVIAIVLSVAMLFGGAPAPTDNIESQPGPVPLCNPTTSNCPN